MKAIKNVKSCSSLKCTPLKMSRYIKNTIVGNIYHIFFAFFIFINDDHVYNSLLFKRTVEKKFSFVVSLIEKDSGIVSYIKYDSLLHV